MLTEMLSLGRVGGGAEENAFSPNPSQSIAPPGELSSSDDSQSPPAEIQAHQVWGSDPEITEMSRFKDC